MRQILALFLFLTASAALADTPDLRCERRHPQERIVAKVVNSHSQAFDLIGDGELVVYDVFDNPIERYRFPVATQIGPEEEVLVYQAVLYHGDMMAYCVFNVDNGSFHTADY